MRKRYLGTVIIAALAIAGCHDPQPVSGDSICEAGATQCSGKDVSFCNGRTWVILEECPEYCNPNTLSCDKKPVSVDPGPNSPQKQCEDQERKCGDAAILYCEDGQWQTFVCDPGEICEPKTVLCMTDEEAHHVEEPEEPDPGETGECRCGSNEYCDAATGKCIEKACELDSSPRCYNQYGYKQCVNFQYENVKCTDGKKCKGGVCILPDDPGPGPDPDPGPDPTETDNSGVNCDAGWITVSASEEERCVYDMNTPLSEEVFEYYCKAGNVRGRNCRLVPAEKEDSLITLQRGQRCTTEQLSPATDTLRIHVIDVGQGDALWIQTPTGENVLVDAGDGGYFGKTNSGPIIKDYLTFHGFEPGSKFDAVFLTHPHSDHYGGMPTLFKSYGIKNYIDPMDIETEEEVAASYKTWIKQMKAMTNAKNIYMPAGDRFEKDAAMPQAFFGKDVGAYFIRSSSTLLSKNPNTASIIFQISYAGRSMIFTGDAEKAQELEAVPSRYVASNFLKVCHHGSTTSSSTEFLKAVWKGIDKGERAAFISSGRYPFSGSYIPDPQIINRFVNNGYLTKSQIFSTSLGDDDKLERETYRDDNILLVIRSDGNYYACYSGTN